MECPKKINAIAQIQNFIFPNGIIYNRELGTVQTFETNPFFALIPQIARLLKKIKNGDSLKIEQIPALVTPAGFKPATATAVMWNSIQLNYGAIM